MTPKFQTLRIRQIAVDKSIQVRDKVDSDAVQDLTEAYIRQAKKDFVGERIPPVVVFWEAPVKTYWLADGFHRCRSKEPEQSIDVLVYEGTQRDALLFAVGCNTGHGVRRTNDDKKRAVKLLLRDPEWSQWSDREIAKRCQVHPSTVDKYRKEVSAENRQMRNGTVHEEDLDPVAPRKARRGKKVYTMQTAGIGKGDELDTLEEDEERAQEAKKLVKDRANIVGAQKAVGKAQERLDKVKHIDVELVATVLAQAADQLQDLLRTIPD